MNGNDSRNRYSYRIISNGDIFRIQCKILGEYGTDFFSYEYDYKTRPAAQLRMDQMIESDIKDAQNDNTNWEVV